MDDAITKAAAAISNASWRATTYIADHEYVMQEKMPDLYDVLEPVIRKYGYDAKFKGFTYRYWNHEGYRYWIVDTFNGVPSGNAAINRAHECAERL
tara:strand:- start:348 stop:635 length:288 start_codon:yes stop_codon:yes gene_type:complete